MKSERRTLVGGLTLAAALALSPVVFAQENPAPSGPMPMGGAAATVTPPNEPGSMRQAKATLASDPSTKYATIQNAASNGTVKLTTQTESTATAEHPQQCAAQINVVT